MTSGSKSINAESQRFEVAVCLLFVCKADKRVRTTASKNGCSWAILLEALRAAEICAVLRVRGTAPASCSSITPAGFMARTWGAGIEATTQRWPAEAIRQGSTDRGEFVAGS